MIRSEKEVGGKDGFEGRWYAHPVLRNTLAATALAALAFALAHSGAIGGTAEAVLFGLAIIVGGYHWSREAVEELIARRQVGIQFLMLAATVGSAGLGMWDEAAFLVVLYGAAEGLEEYTFARTRASIRRLLDLAPKETWILRGNREVRVPAETLRVGDVFLVKPGEAVPTDGVVVRGRSTIDEAPVTGESVPVEKAPGERLFAATINQDGLLEVRATATYADNSLARMVHLVEEARERKGKVQLFIEVFGRRYSPAVLAAAAALAILPPLLGAPFSEWATRAVTLLVAAAPCALVMSTPVAVSTGIGVAGRKGVLIKGGTCLEALGRIRVVALDKTGTLTEGKPEVTDVLAPDSDPRRVLAFAAGLERASTHPLARAVLEKAAAAGLEPEEVRDFRALTGVGVSGQIEGETFYVGKPAFFRERALQPDGAVVALQREGKTVVLLGTEKRIVGVIGIRDRVRSEAADVVRTLHQMGIRVAMLTGDGEAAAAAIARTLAIEDVRAELGPEDKMRIVDELHLRHGPVAMVGDGINDAPALARATVGIAMGAAGTDAALEAADVALMGDDLQKIAYALALGRRARRIGRQNIAFSILLLSALIPAALFGVITVASAVFVHETSELIAVWNGLRVARTPGVVRNPGAEDRGPPSRLELSEGSQARESKTRRDGAEP